MFLVMLTYIVVNTYMQNPNYLTTTESYKGSTVPRNIINFKEKIELNTIISCCWINLDRIYQNKETWKRNYFKIRFTFPLSSAHFDQNMLRQKQKKS